MSDEAVYNASWVDDVDSTINDAFTPISEAITSVVFYEVTVAGAAFPLIVGWLILGATIFTLTFGFVQFRGLAHALQLVRGRYGSDDDPGEVPHFQALTSAVSGTVGLGNIAGVAIAVTIGGAGATFWMIIAGLLGMCTKFVECTVGVKYREIHEDGTVTGGPFKYLPIAFERFGATTAKILTGFFAIALFSFGVAGGNMFQANQTLAQARNVTGGDDGLLGSALGGLIFGLVLAVLVGLVIIGGIKSIGQVTSRLVPAMAIIYVLGCLTVIGLNLGAVPDAFGEIITGAFNPEGVAGGVVGVMIVGFQRAAFSNEAGVGSAPIAHSAVKTKRPVTEGIVALLEPFIDTVIICTMTALTIVIAQPQSWLDGRDAVAAGDDPPEDGVVLTSDAFETVVPWFPNVLALAVALFAFSTLITWSYYSQKAWTTLFGRTPRTERTFQLVFLGFTVLGCLLSLESVISTADAMLFACALVNIFGLYLLLPVVRREFSEYWADRKAGRLVEKVKR